MCRKLVLLVVVFGVIAGFSSMASALPLIGTVNRSGGATGDRAPIGAYDGERDPLDTQAGGLMNGNYIFSDREYTWVNTPAQLIGAEYVRTFNSDKGTTVTYTVTFPIGATVLLTADDRFTSTPQSYVDNIVRDFAAPGEFTDTGWNVFVAGDSDRPLSVFSAVMDPGTYVFHDPASSSNNMYVIGALPLPHKARNPAPADDAMVDADSVVIEWRPGDLAAMHDVYCSTSFDDVNTATTSSGDVYKGRQTELKYPLPDPCDPFATMPVTRGETYYWRIDEVNGVDVWRGDIWNFNVLSELNWGPSPAHQARFVFVTTDLSWRKGNSAKKGHIVYLSTDFASVNNVAPGTVTPGVPPYLGLTSPETVTTIAIPGDLLYNTKYYWRADVVESTTPPPLVAHKGTVWEFETIPDIHITDDPTLIGWWTFDEGADDTIVIDWSGYGNHGAIVGGAQRAPGQIEDAIELNGSGQNVAIANFDEIADAGGAAWPEISIAMWARPDTVSGQRMMWFTHETSGYGKTRCRINGGNWLFTQGQSTTTSNVDATGPAAVAGEWVYYAGVRTNNDALSVYINGVLGGSAAFTTPGNPAVTSWIGTEEGTGNYFDGLIDDVRVYSKALSAAEIRVMGGFLEAWDPIPADEAYSVSAATTIDWLEGPYAASHNVYFGTSYADVKAGTGGTFKGSQLLGNHAYDPPGALEAGKAYYWKIDEVNDLHPDHKWEGPVWTFRVAGGAGGLLGAYYQHTGGASPAGFETFKLSRIDPEINFGWGDGSPDPLVDINDFSCRWTGQVEAKYSEDYIFYTASDDGARLWIDGQLVIDHWVDQGGTEWPSSPIALVAGQKYDIVMEQYENEGGASAYLRWSSPSTSKRIIPPIWLWPPTKASNPVPPDGSTTAPPQQPTLSWTAGVYAAAVNGHRVYFDADEARVIARAGCQVNNVSTTNPSYLLPYTFGLQETYYWAVDEVNGVTWPGDVWSFTTANNKVIDDMETYTDWQIAGNNIVDAWTDGIGDCESTGNGTGSTIYDYPTFSFGGVQSMKYDYDNDGMAYNPCTDKEEPRTYKYSKIVAQVANLPSGIGSDWAAGGARALSLRFWGDPNTTVIEPMWVELTDWGGGHAKRTYGDYIDEDPNDIAEASWHEWVIDLDDFTGVNVSNVKSIAIGIGLEDDIGPYGSGRLYFDEIRLYTPKCVLTRRSADFAALDYAPEAAGGDCVIDYRELEVMTRDWLMADTLVTGELLVHWAFNDASGAIATDSSGKDRTGEISPGTTWANDIERGWCLDFNDGDFVLDNDANAYLNGLHALTVCCWIRATSIGTDQGFIIFEDPAGNDDRGMRYDAAGSNGGGVNVIKCGVTTTATVGNPIQQLESSNSSQTSAWQHIALTWSTGEQLKLYINGVPDTPTDNRPGTVGVTTGATKLIVGKGGKDAAANAGWNGRIDDVRIYNFALTPAEIATVKAGDSVPSRPLHYPTPSPAEIGGNEAEGSMVINFEDYAVLTNRWLEEQLYP